MKRFLTGRVEAFGVLGRAAADLLRAEGAALNHELRGSARRLLGIGLLFLGAAFVLFWTIGALVVSLHELAALWLPRWGAALLIVGLLALVALILILIARRRLAALEAPGAIVQRRAEEYRDWWESRLARPDGEAGSESLGDEASSPRADV